MAASAIKAVAAPVRIPLHIDYIVLDAALRQQLYASGGRAQLWNGEDNCQYLYAENPSIKGRQDSIQIETEGSLNLGLAVAGKCLSPITWSGTIATATAPYISGLALKFRVIDINLYGPGHKKSLIAGHGFDLVKSNFIPKLETFSYSLDPAIHELQELARLAVAPDDQARLGAALSTLQLEPSVVVERDGVRLVLDIEAPEAPPSSASPAPMNASQAAALNATLDSWDAFLVFAIKQIGAAVPDPKVRARLFDVLIDSRERLVAALRQPPGAEGPDPVRILFLDEWTRLRDIIESAARSGKLGSRALEFLSFISAGDALFALDQAAPALGMRISSDDFRRLARIMAPQLVGDPLMYSFDEDPTLQNMLGITPPLRTSGVFDYTEKPVASPMSSPSPTATPGAANASSPVSMLSVISNYAWPAEACAAETYPVEEAQPSETPRKESGSIEKSKKGSTEGQKESLATRIDALGHRLRRVVLDKENADKYRTELSELLTLSADHEMNSDPIEPALRPTFVILTKAVAWQESCWRQFVVRHEKITYIESKTGDIGLMQVNKYVWRGFYSLDRLKWDIVYNASAGSQILMRTLRGAVEHEPAEIVRRPGDLARSAYAAYNGGPNAYDRWRHRHEAAEMRQIDEAFRLKYRSMSEGRSFDIVRCSIEWDRAHGE